MINRRIPAADVVRCAALTALVGSVFLGKKCEGKLKTIDVVIPTMWWAKDVSKCVVDYARCDAVSSVIVIEDDPANGGPREIPDAPKVKRICHGRNIYVNPAWNEGALYSRADILCITSDNIVIDTELFQLISKLDSEAYEIDLIGIDLSEVAETSFRKIVINRASPLEVQFPAFGACMFMPRKKFTPIPNQLLMRFGDDYLAHKSSNLLLMSTPLVEARASTVIDSSPPDSEIQGVIQSDIQWASKNLWTAATNPQSRATMPTTTVDLGCGGAPRNPFRADRAIGIDAHCSGPNILNCWVGFEPLPLSDSSVEYVTAYDFLEHIPRFALKDKPFNPFIDAMGEIWRILKPGGIFLARTPAYPSAAAFQDPTHVNIITDQTVSYFASRPCPDGSFIDEWGPPLGNRYGFKGEFTLVKQWWDTTHLCWKLQAVKSF